MCYKCVDWINTDVSLELSALNIELLFYLGFIKRSFECWATSIKQLLNAGGGHQAPRKAAPSLWKEVRQNIKDKREIRVKDRDLFWGGSREGGEVSTQ